MRIKLLEDIHEHDWRGNSVGIKTTKKKNRAWGPPQVVYDQLVESKEPQHTVIEWVAGAVIEVSEASGQKFIEAGKAAQVE